MGEIATCSVCGKPLIAYARPGDFAIYDHAANPEHWRLGYQRSQEALAAANARAEKAEANRDEWRSGYIHAAVTGRFPVSPHDNDPEIKSLREAAEASFHGQAYAEKARQLRDTEAILKECEDVLHAAKNADNAWFGGEFYDRLDRVIRKLAARKALAAPAASEEGKR